MRIMALKIMALQDKRDKQKGESPPDEKGDPKVRSHIKFPKRGKMGGRVGETRELIHTLHALNCSLYSLN